MSKTKVKLEGKEEKIQFRIRKSLREALVDYCNNHDEKMTEAITNAIEQYIKYKKEK